MQVSLIYIVHTWGQWEVCSCCWMNTPARSQNRLSLWATHVLLSVYSIRKHVSIRSSSSDQFGSSFVLGPLSGNRTLPSILLPVMPSFGPGLDFRISVSKRQRTAADNLSKSALEASSVGVDGTFSLASTLLPSGIACYLCHRGALLICTVYSSNQPQ